MQPEISYDRSMAKINYEVKNTSDGYVVQADKPGGVHDIKGTFNSKEAALLHAEHLNKLAAMRPKKKPH